MPSLAYYTLGSTATWWILFFCLTRTALILKNTGSKRKHFLALLFAQSIDSPPGSLPFILLKPHFFPLSTGVYKNCFPSPAELTKYFELPATSRCLHLLYWCSIKFLNLMFSPLFSISSIDISAHENRRRL